MPPFVVGYIAGVLSVAALVVMAIVAEWMWGRRRPRDYPRTDYEIKERRRLLDFTRRR